MIEFERGDRVVDGAGNRATVETASSKNATLTVQGDNRIHDNAQYRHAPGSPKAEREAEVWHAAAAPSPAAPAMDWLWRNDTANAAARQGNAIGTSPGRTSEAAPPASRTEPVLSQAQRDAARQSRPAPPPQSDQSRQAQAQRSLALVR
jgi:hypothetical protein